MPILKKGKFVVLVGVIGVFNKEILIIQRSLRLKWLPGVWSLPSGKVDLGENTEQSVHRELKEETGLEGKIVQQLPSAEFIGTRDDEILHNIQLNYLISLDNNNVRISEECHSYRWIEIKQLETSELDEYNKMIIRKSLIQIDHFLRNEMR